MLPHITFPQFDADEFLELLFRQQAGLTCRRENGYIRRMLKKHPQARQLLADSRETFPNERFVPIRNRTQRMILYMLIPVLLAAGGGVFSMWYQHHRAATLFPVQGEYSFRYMALPELCRLIEEQYGVKMKIDSRRAAAQHFTGVINESQSLQHLLEDLTRSGNIYYYIDSTGVVHLR